MSDSERGNVQDFVDQRTKVGEAMSKYGFCPTCGAEGVMRERRMDGNDRCQNGHEYPSIDAIPEDFNKAVDVAQKAFEAILDSNAKRSYADLERLAEWLKKTRQRVETTVLTA